MDAMLLAIAFLSLCLSGVLGQFPKACVTEQALKERCCCPLQKDGSMCGIASGRGRCKRSRWPNALRKNSTEQNDDRANWPYEYFDSLCACNDNYGGFDCGICKLGYYGEKCEEQKILERRDIRELSRQERLKFFSYLSLAKMKMSARYSVIMTGNRHDQSTFRFIDASVYNVFAWIHYYAFQPLLLKNDDFDFDINFAHEGPNFLTWHRWYLAAFEKEIQVLTNDFNFTIPYYDWSREGKNCTICNDAFMGKSDSQGVLTSSSYFGSWTSMCSGFNYYDKYCPVADDMCRMEPLHRNPGADPNNNRLPAEKQVQDVLQWKDYDTPPFNISSRRSFRNCLEGFVDPSNGTMRRRSLHNLFHMFMGGTMSQVPLSSNDPIFLLHHAFVDKIFERWIQKYNKTTTDYPKNPIYGHGPDDYMVPSIPPVRNKDYLRRAATFGYKYSNYNPPLPETD